MVEKWDALSPGAQKAVTLTDLCKFTKVTPARFIAAIVVAAFETSNAAILVAIEAMNAPADVALAVRQELARRHFPYGE